MKRILIAGLLATALHMPVSAQEMDDTAEMSVEEGIEAAAEPVQDAQIAAVPPQAAPQAAMPLKLNAGTPIKLMVDTEVNSTTHDETDVFGLTVVEDVKVGDQVVIPRGTPASAEITWRTGKGAFGKSGKMEFAMQSINLGGQDIPISGDYRQDGEGNTIATGVGLLAVGLFAGFITGKRARLPAGRELMSKVVQDIPFTSDGQLDASYDGASAMRSAMEKTAVGQCKLQAAGIEKAKDKKKALKKCYQKRLG